MRCERARTTISNRGRRVLGGIAILVVLSGVGLFYLLGAVFGPRRTHAGLGTVIFLTILGLGSIAGVLMSYNRQITGPKFTNVTIKGAGTYGFDIQATGSAQVSTTTVSNAASGGVNNPSGYTLVRGSGNSGF